jgi:aminopeptidase-like protein
MKLNNGKYIYNLCKQLWPITRSITGDGVRDTLRIIQQEIPNLAINEVSTGAQCFDWVVPKEWNIKDAYILDPDGKKIIDLQENNLHIVGYSVPINKTMPLSELQEHLHSLPNQPDAIPYVTSYYEERWGFCLTESQRKTLVEGDYQVCIDSELSDGSLTYGELIISGKSEKEVFLSTYVCHPSMANNELSGPAVTTYLAKWIQSQPREYTYRIVFIPETIGSICYLSKNIDAMKKNIVAGYNISCVGDDNAYSYLPSRNENTISDRVALHVLENLHLDFVKYSYLDRGSDERQYCSPGVDLPIASVMRTKYGEYREYHTSLDNLDYISSRGLYGAYKVLTKCIECIECNKIYKAAILCEPQMGRRNLRPTLGASTSMATDVKLMSNILVYADGEYDLLDMANKFNISIFELLESVDILVKEGLLECIGVIK